MIWWLSIILGSNELPVAMETLNDLSFLLTLPSLPISCSECHIHWLALSLRHKIHELLNAVFLAWNILHPFCLISTAPFLGWLPTNSPILHLNATSFRKSVLDFLPWFTLSWWDLLCYDSHPPQCVSSLGVKNVSILFTLLKSPLCYSVWQSRCLYVLAEWTSGLIRLLKTMDWVIWVCEKNISS